MSSNPKEETLYSGRSGDKIAIIPLKGEIHGDETPGRSTNSTNPDRMETYLTFAGRDPRVKAVVLEISSPGGTAAASDEIHSLVGVFEDTTRKPVVTYIRDVGASGAYYVACATNRIIASPSALVGSIGVVMQIIKIANALKKLGVDAHVLTSGDLKAAGSQFTDLSPDAKKEFEIILDETQRRFIDVVIRGRPLVSASDLTEISRGGIYSASYAKRLHLVDELGYRGMAIAQARALAHISDATVVTYKLQRSRLEEIMRIANVLNPTSQILERLELESHGQLLYLWNPSLR